MTRSKIALASGVLISLGAPTAAFAQSETTLTTPPVPAGYDRGRNIGVQEQARPDYDPLGIRLGGFIAYPTITVGIGATSNVFLTNNDREGDAYGTISPSFRLTSDWSRHQLTLLGGALFQHYFKENLRNQNAWYTSALARVDVSTDISVSADAGIRKTYESPFSGEVDATRAIVSKYYQTSGSLKGTYVTGRGRAILTYDHQIFDFQPLPLSGGSTSQSARDRNIDRITGQFEYALSPEISAYVQTSYSATTYRRAEIGLPKRSSRAYRILAGANFDITSLVRGTIGVGYAKRDFNSPLFKNVGGLSAEASIEYFPTQLTTVKVELRRIIEDSNLNDSSAYFDNRATLRIDHELLKNLIIAATAEVSRQEYLGSDRHTNLYELTAGGDYYLSHSVSVGMSVAYRNRRVGGITVNGGFDELQGQISLTVQR